MEHAALSAQLCTAYCLLEQAPGIQVCQSQSLHSGLLQPMNDSCRVPCAPEDSN